MLGSFHICENHQLHFLNKLLITYLDSWKKTNILMSTWIFILPYIIKNN
jgi:hypothetical protein